MNRRPLTKRGAQKLRDELRKLKTGARPKIINAIAEARAHGDLRENAEYHAAKEQQGFIEGRIAEIEGWLGSAEIIDPATVNAGGRVVFGATVELLHFSTDAEVRYQIVGDVEADIGAGLVSISSPIARALIGREEGDVITVAAPDGEIEYEILSVEYIGDPIEFGTDERRHQAQFRDTSPTIDEKGRSSSDPAAQKHVEFGEDERRRQARFRDTSPTIDEKGRSPSDPAGQQYGYLLALGHEEQNLYPGLRDEDGQEGPAMMFFRERRNHGLRWWQDKSNGDCSRGERPTRNLSSSQIACVNFLLPLREIPGALTAVLQAIDDDVNDVVDIPDEDRISKVEIEWIGLRHALEGENVKTRGAFSTSVDAFMVADTGVGRRAYLLEWKYVEDYRKTERLNGRNETRHQRYVNFYRESPTFNGKVPLDAWFFKPFYQIMRLRLLADRMVKRRELDVCEAKVVVVVPKGNLAYREQITSSPKLVALAEQQYPKLRTVTDVVVRATLKQPDDAYASVCPSTLAAAVREKCGEAVSGWSEYQRERYGW